MTLLGTVAELLRARGTPFALIGAGALAIHGINRATTDLDVLVVDRRCLDRAFWTGPPDLDVSIRSGGVDDPLAGVVRIRARRAEPIDIVVGNARWQADVVAAATPTSVQGHDVPVARPADLVLLKLYAGGPQDVADIEQLLRTVGTEPITPEVDRRLGDLPEDARHLWRRLRVLP